MPFNPTKCLVRGLAANAALGLLGGIAHPALAADPLGFYVGGAVAQAHVRATVPFNDYGFDQQHSGWKVLLGLHPLPLVAAELEYIDFGHPTATAANPPSNNGLYSIENADVRQRATALSGLIYLPLPVPLLKLYGKAGLARLQTSANARVTYGCDTSIVRICPPPALLPPVALSETQNHLTYGAGAQLQLAQVAVRLEYQRFSAAGANPDLLSVGITLTL
jgi:opacity protein-like surface antigen